MTDANECPTCGKPKCRVDHERFTLCDFGGSVTRCHGHAAPPAAEPTPTQQTIDRASAAFDKLPDWQKNEPLRDTAAVRRTVRPESTPAADHARIVAELRRSEAALVAEKDAQIVRWRKRALDMEQEMQMWRQERITMGHKEPK